MTFSQSNCAVLCSLPVCRTLSIRLKGSREQALLKENSLVALTRLSSVSPQAQLSILNMMHFILKSLCIFGLSSLALVRASPTKKIGDTSETLEQRPRLVRRIYDPTFDKHYRGPPVGVARDASMEYHICMYKFVRKSTAAT